MPLSITNDLGICTVSLGSWKHHSLEVKLQEAARAGFRAIDLFDDDWAEHLSSHGIDATDPWEPSPEKLECASKLGSFIKDLGMYIACTQPLRSIEGVNDPSERATAFCHVAKRFPFMRAFDTDLTFLCSSVRQSPGATVDFQAVVRDLRELGDMAATYSRKDGGKMLRIGYEGLSWSQRNTWSSTWEVVRAVNRPNVGLVVDTFNMLAVEFADPYAPTGNGTLYPTMEEALDVVCASLASFVSSVPAAKIFLVQIADAQLMDPHTFHPPTDDTIPRLMPWSRGYRLYPMEQDRGGYMPVDVVTSAVLATGYQGPLTVEVFSKSLHESDSSVPAEHAHRAIIGLDRLMEGLHKVPDLWSSVTRPISERRGHKLLSQQRQLSGLYQFPQSRL